MSYIPPFCETTGIQIERCESQKLNGTTAINSDIIILKDFRYIQFQSKKDDQNNFNFYANQYYKVYLQFPDSVKVGDKIKFNESNYMKKIAYDLNLPDTVKLEIKQIQNYQISNCEGYIEVVCLKYN